MMDGCITSANINVGKKNTTHIMVLKCDLKQEKLNKWMLFFVDMSRQLNIFFMFSLSGESDENRSSQTRVKPLNKCISYDCPAPLAGLFMQIQGHFLSRCIDIFFSSHLELKLKRLQCCQNTVGPWVVHFGTSAYSFHAISSSNNMCPQAQSVSGMCQARAAFTLEMKEIKVK